MSAHHDKELYTRQCYGIQLTGAGGLLSEALSVLNGAHFHPNGYMGNLLRRYHQMMKSSSVIDAENSTHKQVCSCSTLQRFTHICF